MTIAWHRESRACSLRGEVEILLRGDHISANRAASRFGRVETGLVAEVRVQDERQFAVHVHRAGDLIGEGVVLADPALMTGSHLEALLPSRIRWHDGPMEPDPTLTALALGVLAARTRHQHDVATRRRLQSRPQQVADWLLELQDCTAWGLPEDALSHLTRQGLGTLVGSTRSSVSAILGRFEQLGWISRAEGGLLITDELALATYAGNSAAARHQIAGQLRRSQDALAAYAGLLPPQAPTAIEDDGAW